jgi:hypothetical protein
MDIGKSELSARVPALRWVDPDQVGEIVLDAVQRKELYAFTHPEMFASVQARFAAIRESNERAATRQELHEHEAK